VQTITWENFDLLTAFDVPCESGFDANCYIRNCRIGEE